METESSGRLGESRSDDIQAVNPADITPECLTALEKNALFLESLLESSDSDSI